MEVTRTLARFVVGSNPADAPAAVRKEAARSLLPQTRGQRYAPQVLDAFIGMMGGPVQEITGERPVLAADLREGMVLARDFFGRDGVLLLAADYILDVRLVEHIQDAYRLDGGGMRLYVRTDRR